jgi:hypothetical protein
MLPILSVGASFKYRLVFISGEKYDFIRFSPTIYLGESIAAVVEIKGFGLIIGDFLIAQDKNISVGLIVFLPFQKPDVIIG